MAEQGVQFPGGIQPGQIAITTDVPVVDEDLWDGVAVAALDHDPLRFAVMVHGDLGEFDTLTREQLAGAGAVTAIGLRIHQDMGHGRALLLVCAGSDVRPYLVVVKST